ncbi:hypothetical protein CHS0354_002934 [Potamilus streckersoni]|uniref:C-type lectin domain-containing protein n=1 Tax=Potamilus streckersoni TaxID=2493646 RepID=A0AAE0RQE3_9BIVA|nr:hypothetical protein CHS0354_002934 [Potamilus streckersoni]
MLGIWCFKTQHKQRKKKTEEDGDISYVVTSTPGLIERLVGITLPVFQLHGLQVYIRKLGKGIVVNYIYDSNGGTYTVQLTSIQPTSIQPTRIQPTRIQPTSIQPTSTRITTISCTSTIQTTVEPQLVCRAGYVLYAGPGTPFFYRYENKCLSWEAARSLCVMEGTDLVVLDDQNLPGFGDLMNRIFQAGPRICPSAFGIWIGAKSTMKMEDLDSEYINGTKIPLNNPLWQDMPPNIFTRLCFQYNTDTQNMTKLKINTHPCTIDVAFVCQQRR